MITTNYNAVVTGLCTANISISGCRLKTDNSKVYLKDKQEFQIELFNGDVVTKLAKISINGKLISTSGIVLKPGQRVYLERYLDDNHKFKFETYEVDNSQESKAAISYNGDIEVSFYNEKVVNPPYILSRGITFNSLNDYINSTSRGNINSFFTDVSNTGSLSGMQTNSLKQSSIASLRSVDSPIEVTMDWMEQEKSIETGRVEKGNKSNQSFITYNGDFEWIASQIVKIKLLPISQKQLEAKDLATYCTECGTKNKGNKFKFCPKCGTKY